MEIGGVTYKWSTETRVTVAIIGCTLLGFALKWIGSGKRMSVEETWLERRASGWSLPSHERHAYFPRSYMWTNVNSMRSRRLSCAFDADLVQGVTARAYALLFGQLVLGGNARNVVGELASAAAPSLER